MIDFANLPDQIDFSGLPDKIEEPEKEGHWEGWIKPTLKQIGEEAKALPYGLMKGAQAGVQFFDDAATLISRATGWEKGNLFRTLAEMGEPPGDYTPQSFAEEVVAGIGEAIPEIGMISSLPGPAMVTMGYMGAIRGGARGGAKEAVKEGAKGALLGGTLKGAAMLPKAAQIPTTGGIFGGMEAAEGGEPREIAKATAIGVGLGLAGGKGKSLKQIAEDFKARNKRPVLPAKPTTKLRKAEEIKAREKGYQAVEPKEPGEVVYKKLPPEKPKTPPAIEGKAGVKGKLPIDRYEGHLTQLLDAVKQGEVALIPGREGTKVRASTYPDFMRGKGWEGKKVAIAIEKGIKGEKLGTQQEVMFEAALNQAKELYKKDLKEYARIRKEAIEEEKARGIQERNLEESIKREVTDEVAREAEFAKAEREAIQTESERFFKEDVSFKPEGFERELPSLKKLPFRKAIPSETFEPLPKGKTRASIIKQMETALEVPIRTGKFRKKVAGRERAAIYKQKQQVVRLAKANDLVSATHEVAHHFEKLLKLPDTMPQEVRKMAYEGAKDLDREGFAEYVKYYVTEPAKVRKEAPEFTKRFEKAIAGHPDIQDVLVKAREAWNLWEAAPSVSKVHSMIRRKTSRNLPTLNEIYTTGKDNLYPLQLAMKAAKKKGIELKTSENAYLMARLTRGWARKGEQYLKFQPFQYDPVTGVKFTGKSLREILRPHEQKGEIELLDTYLIAKRAESDPRILKGFEGILSKDDFRQVIKELEPRFEKTAKAFYEYSDNLLTYLVDSGRISKETADAIRSKNLFYAPFYRVMDVESPLGGLSSKKFSNVINPIKKLKGSSRDIYSPTESMVYNTYTIINAAERNRVGNALIRLADKPGMGEIIEKVPFPLKPVKMSKDEALRSLTREMNPDVRKQFLDILETMPEDALQDMALTFRPTYRPGPNEAIFYDKGKPILFELSPDLARAIGNINASDVGLLVRIAAYPAKWLRAGATTFSPEFAIRNPVRDQMTAWIQTKYGYKPAWDFLRGIYHMAGKSELWQKFNASGGAHSSIVSIDRNYISKNLKAMLQEGSVKGMVKHPLELLQKFSEYTEEATRVGEFLRALKKEGGDVEALYKAGIAAREVSLDFARQGEGSARAANLISAFWNARIEGIDKMTRTFKENPVEASAKAFLGVTLPSILLWYAQKDDPYYQELPSWRRTLFWNFVIHNKDGSLKTILSIPKPFEYGLIFGSIPETALDWAYSKDPAAFKETMETFVKTFNFLPLPTGLIPIGEWWANKSLFFDRPIVPRGKEELQPVLQYKGYTSETVKLAARIMDKVPGLKDVASPAKIENLIKGYTAGVGRLALEEADWLLETFGVVDTPPDPSMSIADIPGIRAFFSHFPSANTRSIENFYKKYTDMSRKWESAKERIGIRGKGIRTEIPLQLQKYRKTATALSTVRKMVNVVYESKELKPEEKREALDNLYLAMINLARSTMGQKPISIRKPE
jgi:hypothetical protein